MKGKVEMAKAEPGEGHPQMAQILLPNCNFDPSLNLYPSLNLSLDLNLDLSLSCSA